jgi:hypothetical protein
MGADAQPVPAVVGQVHDEAGVGELAEQVISG